MAGEGRGSASRRAVALGLLALLCLLISAEATVYTVGDSKGWTFNLVNWPSTKRFKAGDVLVFNYSPSAHNVVVVGAAGYRRCSTPSRAKIYNSGSDRVTLRRGTNYFICSFTGHCQGGMRIAVTAA